MYYVALFAFEFSSLNQNNGQQSTLCPSLTIIKNKITLRNGRAGQEVLYSPPRFIVQFSPDD